MWDRIYGKPAADGDDEATPQRTPWSYLTLLEQVGVIFGLIFFFLGGGVVGAAMPEEPVVFLAWMSATGLALSGMFLAVARTRKIQAEA